MPVDTKKLRMVELLPVNRLDIKEKMEKRSGIMRYKISQKDYDKIEELVKCALSAYNKAEAKIIFSKSAMFLIIWLGRQITS